MTTEDFLAFCNEQRRQSNAERERFAIELDSIRLDLQRIHDSRHAAQAGISDVISEMRVDHDQLQKTVALLADSIKELVIALKGSYGGQGLVASVSDLRNRTVVLENALLAAKSGMAGMRWIIGSSVVAGGVVVSVAEWLLRRAAP